MIFRFYVQVPDAIAALGLYDARPGIGFKFGSSEVLSWFAAVVEGYRDWARVRAGARYVSRGQLAHFGALPGSDVGPGGAGPRTMET